MILHPFTAYTQENKYPISNTSKKTTAFRIRMIDGKKPQRFFLKLEISIKMQSIILLLKVFILLFKVF